MARNATARMNVTAEMMLNTSACRMNGMSRLMRKNSIRAFGYLSSFPRKRESSVVFCIKSLKVTGSPLSRGRLRPLRGRRRLPDLADRYLVELLASAVDDRDQTARDEHRGEHRRENAEAVHDRESAHGPGAEDQERDAGDERGHVRVENRVPGALVPGLDRRMRRIAPAKLLADALVDQHVGVDRHAEGQRHRGA